MSSSEYDDYSYPQLEEREITWVIKHAQTCPFCGRGGLEASVSEGLDEPPYVVTRRAVYCLCGIHGPECETIEEAVQKWNELVDRVLPLGFSYKLLSHRTHLITKPTKEDHIIIKKR